MVIDFLKTIEESGMLRRGETVLCALSGGADSSVLLDLLVKNSESLGIKVCAAHLNHMLRGTDADADEAFVKEKCEKYGIELICERADIAAIAKARGESTELAARNVRYDFLHRAKEKLGAVKIATAHNANDNLETMLFNISRGGGVDGMRGIPPVRGDIIRPLLYISRSEIEKYAEENGVSFCTDKTNLETVYTRNKIRHNVIPALVEVNSSAVANAARSARILSAESDYLMCEARRTADEISCGKGTLDRKKTASIHNAIFARVCEIFAADALEKEKCTLEWVHISDIKSLCLSDCPSGQIDLPEGLKARCEYDKLIFERAEEKEALQEIELTEGEFSVAAGRYTVTVKKIENVGKINKSLNTFLVPCDKIEHGLFLRKREIGDEIKLRNRPVKTLKKLFIEARIPKSERETIPVIADGEKVIAVFGFGQDCRYMPEYREKVFEINIIQGEGLS